MQRPVDRQFYSIDSNTANKSHFQTPSSTQKEKLVENVAESIIGKDKTFSGPFGQRKGKRSCEHLHVNDALKDNSSPLQGNIQSNVSSVTSNQELRNKCWL